ncbi:transcriptional regulator [Sulfuriferula nivalis]|uniref:Transcriptional regulator n=2 Tax=Sulfuriferula nivalis TaxID=2675298 RepID=A0A809S8N2_9PROT|nr:transcriptional regulator [Sulfuriferula nivalis]
MVLFMFEYIDSLSALNTNSPLLEKLQKIHAMLQVRFDSISRIAVALYDPKTDLLKTYLHSSGEDKPLNHYQALLHETPSLMDIVTTGKPRVVNDLSIFAEGEREHTRRIAAQGYGSSYTLPMYMNGSLFGFVFFDSYQKNVLNEEALHFLDVIGHLVSLLVMNEIAAVRTLVSTVQAARDMANLRDQETGAHIDRMSHFSRIIARELAPTYGFNDEFIEHVFLFSPLHDIGKIGIPDSILLKTGILTDAEFEIMKSHTLKGREIVDTILKGFALDGFEHIDMLRNIAEFHHETLDGKGYPHGLRGDAIPIEARIIAVADVFDALTSRRPYKPAWSNEQAFQNLLSLADIKLDRQCIEALLNNRAEVEVIQEKFKEDVFA